MEPMMIIEKTEIITNSPEEITPDEEVELAGRKYKVLIAETEMEREVGLQGVEELPEDEGMLFIHDQPESVEYWMKDCNIPLSIVFMDEDGEVISVKDGVPGSEKLLHEDNVKYVLEINPRKDIKPGDEMEWEGLDEKFDVENCKMYIVGPNGKPQMFLEGGERIVSIKETRTLLKKVKKARNTKTDSAYKALGEYMFKVLEGQDNREPEYVETKKPE